MPPERAARPEPAQACKQAKRLHHHRVAVWALWLLFEARGGEVVRGRKGSVTGDVSKTPPQKNTKKIPEQ